MHFEILKLTRQKLRYGDALFGLYSPKKLYNSHCDINMFALKSDENIIINLIKDTMIFEY